MATKNQVEKVILLAPKKPGVYLFRDKNNRVLYVGKAVSLASRLRSYLTPSGKLSLKTSKFLEKAKEVSWITVRSELEAILLEMNLIKQLKPPYNMVGKDDKRPLYVVITPEQLPKVLITRNAHKIKIKGGFTGADYFGPFPSAYKLRQIMRYLRRIFPYCSCKNPKKPCLYTNIGLCQPSPPLISSQAQIHKYKRQVKLLRIFLSGKVNRVVRLLKKAMAGASREKQYETAAQIRDQIQTIKNLINQKTQIGEYLTDRTLQPNLAEIQLKALKKTLKLKRISRIEGYDVSNIGGHWSTASMVVFENGIANTASYRQFKVRLPEIPNDPAMLAETVSRRLHHLEWPLPDLILLDGGKGQLSRVKKVIDSARFKIRLVGLAKKRESVFMFDKNSWQELLLPPESPALNLLKQIRDEAHRFARKYHLFLRKKNLLTGKDKRD